MITSLAKLGAIIIAVATIGVASAQPADTRRGREAPQNTEREPDLPSPDPLAVVRFSRGSVRLDADGRDALARAARWMADHPLQLLLVEGHADASGGQASNLRLSQRRTDAVREELIRQGGDPQRIVASAHGETEPAGSAAASRRVVVRGTLEPYGELIRAQRADPDVRTRERRAAEERRPPPPPPS